MLNLRRQIATHEIVRFESNYSSAIGFLDVNVLNRYTHYCTEIHVMYNLAIAPRLWSFNIPKFCKGWFNFLEF